MQWRNTKEGFGWISIVLHWVTVPLVIFLLACGIYMKTLDYYDPLYHQLPQWHKTFGMLLGTLLLIRLGWIVISPAPTPITPNLLQRWLAKGVHSSKEAQNLKIRQLFITLGNFYHRFDSTINRKFLKINSQFAYKPLSDELALEKGIEFFY